MHSLPGVNQPWVVYCAPAEVFYFGHIRGLLVELAHGLQSEARKCGTVTSTIGEHIEECEERREALRPDCLEKVIRKRGTAMWCRDGGYGEDAKSVVV